MPSSLERICGREFLQIVQVILMENDNASSLILATYQ